MFRITRDPSSGNFMQCLAKITGNGSIVSIDMDVVSVTAAYLPMVISAYHHMFVVLSSVGDMTTQ